MARVTKRGVFMRGRVLSILICLFSGFGAVAETVENARLTEAEAILVDQPWADLAAWQALSSHGLPLIDNHPENETLSRVTFAYRGSPDIVSVRLDSVLNAPYAAPWVSDYHRDFTLPLSRIAGSDIWSLTLDVHRDVQASYSFLVETDAGFIRRGDPANPRRLRGQDAEAVLIGDRVGEASAWRPIPPRLQRPAQALVMDSEALNRAVFLNVHPAVTENPDAPILILYDSFLWGVRAPAWEIVQNLVDQGRIPPVHVVLIDQIDAASAALNYADQSAFIADELLPYLSSQSGLTGPVILGGASRRGLSATITALQNPDDIDAVISLSGSFYWAPEGDAMEWLPRQIRQAPDRAPRFYLAAGSLEYAPTSTNRGHVMLDTNQRMAEALISSGYEVELDIFAGGHDIAAWRAALAEGLVSLLGEPANAPD